MRMLHGNLKAKFSVAGGETIYTAVFFNNRNHADDTNSVIALMGNGDLILEDRFHGVGVDHINTEAVAFFVDFKFDVGIVRVSGLKARNNSHKSATLSASTCAVFTRSPPIAAAMASHFAFVRLASITSEKIGLAAIFCATTVPTPPAPIIRALHIKFILF